MKRSHFVSCRETKSLEERIRERAYYLWLERGCPHGEDWEHWFAAQQQLRPAEAAGRTDHVAREDDAAPAYSSRAMAKALRSGPPHRYRAPGGVHDRRLDVIAHEAGQRGRVQQVGGQLPAQTAGRP